MTKTRRAAATGPQPEIDRFRAQHLSLATQRLAGEAGGEQVTIDDGESRWRGWRAARGAVARP